MRLTPFRPARFAAALAAGACAIALTACTAVGPDYRPPRPSHPSDWTERGDGAVRAGPAQLQDWWRAFRDPLLDKLIAQAIEGNQDLAIARQRLLQARAERDQIASRLGPTVSASGTAEALRSSRALDWPPGIGQSRTYRLGFDASWELDLFGGARRAIESADAQVDAIDEDRHAILVSLLAELASDYAELRASQARLQIATDNVASLDATRRLTERSERRGLGTSFEVAQARAELELAQAALPPLQANVARLIHAIGVLTGGFPGELRDALSAPGATLPAAPRLPVTLPSDMIGERPDVRAAERRFAAATAQIGVARAAQFPHFAIPLSLGTTASLVQDLFTSANVAWSVALEGTQTLYDGGRAKAGVSAARAAAEAARIAYAQRVRVAFREVEDALTAIYAERDRQAALVAAVGSSQDAQSRATRLYRNGLNEYLSVLIAQRATYRARDALALSRLARVQGVIALYKALGAGWRQDAPVAQADDPPQRRAR
ncbi:efflux transporter outer membrane subunit [Burkholderia oklahomensis]|uniref:Efflux transporter, outer membrane factor (OMF) lipo, NodT family protein n=2 Tax=Burkholderia oklahomensis TaxID=342113 RepID=A0AAI8FRH3_9BURK|nr:efflux transporter outer membrane subunit [Burkholderia oklahomensis]AIO70726.1 efflux transporter, outer membrane factor (OMF) lipo, NodT family protein [Burkholderia oklahomensis]AOI40300.1 RND transporter [Burkholderia oklahomensis EO147]KUY65174.1 RND transporter [Burkholderia oklahomensis EO147]QPS39333.1 efflux transporter outer membrane subunit [Burkholderia oklahomensis]